MKEKILQMREQLGPTGLASLALLAAAIAFFALAVQPLEQKDRALRAALERRAAAGADYGPDQLAAFYRFLERKEETTDWLAKLHGIARATGVDLRSATYRTQDAGTRLERYEIVVPVSGSYGQIRDFLKRTLAEVPVLSLDQVSLKRESRNDAQVRAELRMAIHRMKK
jgi:Tfp pilus assembly protein PilO